VGAQGIGETLERDVAVTDRVNGPWQVDHLTAEWDNEWDLSARGASMRVHVVISDEVVRDVDRVVGARERSQFIEQAVREKLRRGAQDWAIDFGAGLFVRANAAYGPMAEDAAEWVRRQRRVDRERAQEKVPDQS
jgi:hypothetical protein